jgi:hypothetical protein
MKMVMSLSIRSDSGSEKMLQPRKIAAYESEWKIP